MPGPLITQGDGRLRWETRFEKPMFGTSYITLVIRATGSMYPLTGDEWVDES